MLSCGHLVNVLKYLGTLEIMEIVSSRNRVTSSSVESSIFTANQIVSSNRIAEEILIW